MALPKNLKINTKLFDDLRAAIPEMAGLQLVVGVLAERYGAELVEGTDITYAELATIQEFGSPKNGIPERSFLRATFADKTLHRKITKVIGEKIADVGHTGSKRIRQLDSAMSTVGWLIVNAVKARIRAGIAPALAPSTIKARQAAGREGVTPLFDTKHLINSISWSTRNEG